MAILLAQCDALVLLPPKTGSKWLRAAFSASDIQHVELWPRLSNGHGTLSDYGRSFSTIISTVRHPAEWHFSYWRYRTLGKSKWDESWMLDRLCRSSNFETYIKSATKYCRGYVTAMFEDYVGPLENPITFVCKRESLRTDIVEVLEKMNLQFDANIFLNFPARNVGVDWDIPMPLREIVFVAEQAMYERYNYSL